MGILIQIGIIFGVCLLSQTISSLLPFSIPTSVIAMSLLLLLLCLGILKTKHIEKTGDFMLKHMSFFFIPAGVGILDYYGSIKDSILQLLLICFITTVFTFAVTAKTVEAVIKLQEWLRSKRHE